MDKTIIAVRRKRQSRFTQGEFEAKANSHWAEETVAAWRRIIDQTTWNAP